MQQLLGRQSKADKTQVWWLFAFMFLSFVHAGYHGNHYLPQVCAQNLCMASTADSL